MRRWVILVAVMTAVLPLAQAQAAEPADQDDPCSVAGRDDCGTTGAGRYKTYRYGLRWFGDYRGAIPGLDDPAFCIDLRFWYPGKQYGYEQRTPDVLKNRDGETVSARDLRRMAYALWNYGRSDSDARQGAVMLYVHDLMGDGAAGEVDPAAVGLSQPFAKIARESERLAGPYTVEASLPDGDLTEGKKTTLSLKVTAASGARMANTPVEIEADGAEVDADVRTGSDGTATVKLVPTSAKANLSLKAVAGDLAATRPDLYVPTKGKAARNGQRLAAPASDRYADTLHRAVKPQLEVVTTVSTPTLEPGGTLFDTLVVTGTDGKTVGIAAKLFGPFGTEKDLDCGGKPVWTGTVTAKGDGTYETEPTTLDEPGYYTYRESVPGVFTAPCGAKAETAIVRGDPEVVTKVSDATITPGSKLTDTLTVTGLGKLTAPVSLELFGPFDRQKDISCDGKPFWTGTVTAKGDGAYESGAATIGKAGYYSYRESLEATDAYDATEGKCGEKAETSLVTARPRITTLASSDAVIPNQDIRDRVSIRGLGRTPATVRVEVFGPFASREAIRCSDGRRAGRSSLEVRGDGVVRSEPFTVRKVGFYVFRERIADAPGVVGTTTECAIEAETSLGRPEIITGRGDRTRKVAATAAGPVPTRVTVAGTPIDAPVDPIGINLGKGVLGVDPDIDRVGWWRDGAAVGDARGAVLLAGHVDSAARGAGALYALKSADRGDRVRVELRGGGSSTYRVQSVRTVLKSRLPASVYSKRGAARLVIVTCGGPFDTGSGHYRDNVILTATPA